MSAYVIVSAEITDAEKFRDYLTASPRTIERYGGRYLARGGESVVLEGVNSGERTVIIEFPSLDRAREWYDSKEYREVRKLRAGAATGTITVVEGI